MHRFLDSLNRRPEATDAVIGEGQKLLGVKLPTEYVAFLKLANGGEGFIGNEYVIFWPVEEPMLKPLAVFLYLRQEKSFLKMEGP